LKRLLVTYNCDLYYFLVLWIYPKSMDSSHVCFCALIVFNGKRHFCLAKLSMKRQIIFYMSLFSFSFYFLFIFFFSSFSWASFSLSFNFLYYDLSCFENYSQKFELMVKPWTKQKLKLLKMYAYKIAFKFLTYTKTFFNAKT
jgi:hypothetical protein